MKSLEEKTIAKRLIMVGFIVLLGAALAACDVDVEEKGSLPNVDVDAEPGQLPEYEITKTQDGKMPDVDVDVKGGEMPELEVRGPEVEVKTKKVEVTVPDVDVKMPKEREG